MPAITDKGSDVGRMRELLALAIAKTMPAEWDGEGLADDQLAELLALLANALMILARASEFDPRQIATNLRDGLRSVYAGKLEPSQTIVAQAIADAVAMRAAAGV